MATAAARTQTAAGAGARLRGEITLGVGVAVVQQTLGAADAGHGVDCRSHAVGRVFAGSSSVLFRPERVLTVFATHPAHALADGRVQVADAHLCAGRAAVAAPAFLLAAVALVGQHGHRAVVAAAQ